MEGDNDMDMGDGMKKKTVVIEGIVRCDHDGGNVVPSNKKNDLNDVLLLHFDGRKVKVTIEDLEIAQG